jgi:chromatin assembly factor 1 subunit A
MSQLSEAEISLNDELVRDILEKLRNRELLPAKAFCFHTDTRPGYFGTWTRSSRIIGPRNPLATDTLVFDYGYDSGEEWEQESVVGEEVEDDGKDEDGDAEDADSDLDSWLVDDDEVPDTAMLDHQNSPPPPFFDFPNVHPKRKAEDTERKIGKKRKVVVPLVPFAKGPVWESTIGVSQYEPFKPYAIQLFNGRC